MFSSGVFLRAKPYLRVLQGFDPNEPQTRSRSAPVKSGVTVVSGNVIVLEYVSANAQWEWVLADRAEAAHRKQVPHFALQDATDSDVAAAGQLTGLSCSGQFELQTGYFVTPSGGEPLTNGAALSYGTGANVGKVEAVLRGAGPTIPVVGFISGAHNAGAIDLTGQCSEATSNTVVQLTTTYDAANAAS